jgi:hypothetical protein
MLIFSEAHVEWDFYIILQVGIVIGDILFAVMPDQLGDVDGTLQVSSTTRIEKKYMNI